MFSTLWNRIEEWLLEQDHDENAKIIDAALAKGPAGPNPSAQQPVKKKVKGAAAKAAADNAAAAGDAVAPGTSKRAVRRAKAAAAKAEADAAAAAGQAKGKGKGKKLANLTPQG